VDVFEIKHLSSLRGFQLGKKEEQKMRDDPTMSMKTKEVMSYILDHPTMFIKTNDLIF